MKITRKHSLLTGIILLSLSTLTFAKGDVTPVSIPMIENAQIFADFTDGMPAVLNYYTLATQEQIISFYKENYGDSTSQETKRNRLTLTFEKNKQSIRVTISQQNNKREVDIIVAKL